MAKKLPWEKEGVNYWENPDCPREYLEKALVNLVAFVEEVELPLGYFREMSREALVRQIDFLEYVSEK